MISTTNHVKNNRDIINITHESAIWNIFGNFSKPSLLGSFVFLCFCFVLFFIVEPWLENFFFFINYYTPFFFPNTLSVSMLLSNNSPGNTKLSLVSPRFSLYIFHMFTFVFACSSGEKPFIHQKSIHDQVALITNRKQR